MIRAVSTGVAAFVDFFREGPMNTPVRTFGADEFERIFGGQDSRSAASHQIPQFFLNGGSEAWGIRVAADDMSTTPATAPAASTVTIADGGGTDRLAVAAANPGAWGDALRVEADHDVDESDATDLRFDMRVTRHASTAGNAPVVTRETFLKLSLEGASPRFVETAVNRAAGSVTTMTRLRGRSAAAIRAADMSIPGCAGARVTLANGRFRILAGRAGAACAPPTRSR